jgi:DUF2934 family protein
MPRTNKPGNGSSDSPKPARRSKKSNGAAEPFNDADAVARRAYEIYQRRGGDHGADLDDWLEAERELRPGPGDVTGPARAKPRRRKSSEGTV